jgi:hypothetical protein
MQNIRTNAVKAERERVAAIRALPEARGNEDRAMQLALSTNLSVDQIKAALAGEVGALWDAALTSRGMKINPAAPKTSTEAAASPWDAVLAKRFAVGA